MFLTQPCSGRVVKLVLALSSEDKWKVWVPSTISPANSPLVSSALLDYDIRSLELPNGGQWPRLMIPELGQRHHRLPQWLPSIQLGWVIGCGWGVVVKPNVESLGMCAQATDGAGGGKSCCGNRDRQGNRIYIYIFLQVTRTFTVTRRSVPTDVVGGWGGISRSRQEVSLSVEKKHRIPDETLLKKSIASFLFGSCLHAIASCYCDKNDNCNIRQHGVLATFHKWNGSSNAANRQIKMGGGNNIHLYLSLSLQEQRHRLKIHLSRI